MSSSYGRTLAPPPLLTPSIDYEWERPKGVLETRLICEMHGAAPPSGWTSSADIDGNAIR
jgi:hypothetical protein